MLHVVMDHPTQPIRRVKSIAILLVEAVLELGCVQNDLRLPTELDDVQGQ